MFVLFFSTPLSKATTNTVSYQSSEPVAYKPSPSPTSYKPIQTTYKPTTAPTHYKSASVPASSMSNNSSSPMPYQASNPHTKTDSYEDRKSSSRLVCCNIYIYTYHIYMLTNSPAVSINFFVGILIEEWLLVICLLLRKFCQIICVWNTHDYIINLFFMPLLYCIQPTYSFLLLNTVISTCILSILSFSSQPDVEYHKIDHRESQRRMYDDTNNSEWRPSVHTDSKAQSPTFAALQRSGNGMFWF